jgi:hypothetical protein
MTRIFIEEIAAGVAVAIFCSTMGLWVAILTGAI